MPIFEFECLECGVIFERLLRKAGAVSDVSCPVCGSRRVDERLSTFASLVKTGSGGSDRSCAPGGG